MASPEEPAGNLTFTPATTQTTVVTTTTTTVTIPPFVFQPSDHAHKDPRHFPLASADTPANMRDFTFELGGRSASFKEAPLDASLQKYHRQQAALAEANGTLVRTHTSEDSYRTPLKKPQHSLSQASLRHRESKMNTQPPSIMEAAELAALDRRQKRQITFLSAAQSQDKRVLTRSGISEEPTLDLPVTPDLEAGPPLDRSSNIQQSTSDAVPVEIRRSARSRRHVSSDGNSHVTGSSARSSLSNANSNGEVVAKTPPAGAGEAEDTATVFAQPRPLRARPNRAPPGALAFPPQDVSLPSPSLSPVTAAANLARNRSRISDQDGNTSQPKPVALSSRKDAQVDNANTITGPARTVMDIPEMIRMFDAMPESLQSYVSFQLLKCCSKTTLRSLSQTVEQALKIDPFDVLPVEVCIQITSLLDAKSLSSASQVSRRWRHYVNSNETAWKNLMDYERFVLSDDELQRAIREGWGWQSEGRSGHERDLSASSKATERMRALSHSSTLQLDEHDRRPSGLKRKASTQISGSKRQKQKQISTTTALVRTSADSHQPVIATGSSPFEYANAAAKIPPHPKAGLSSLRDMHLFRSLYQRQQLIRQSWMDHESHPKHLAFGAHSRHVVTCLLFDENRIITGCDDNHIHIYDTQTGRLKSKLEGHDGGVWALACDGDTLVSGSTDRTVRIWNLATQECKHVFMGHTSTVRCLVILKPTVVGHNEDGTPIIHPQEPTIITGSRDSTLRAWKLPDLHAPANPHPREDTDNPYALRQLTGHHNSVRAIAAHGDTLVSGSYDQTVRHWKISTGECEHRLAGHNEKVYSVVLDYENHRCISGSMDKLVKVWDLTNGECLFNLTGHTSLVGLLDLSRNFLVSAAADMTLRVWDPRTGRCISKLKAHTGAITCFQHDEEKVISGSEKTLKMWDIRTGECIRDLLTGLSGVWQVKFDQRRCVAAVQREDVTYIEVLDFGAARDGTPASDLGRRIVVDEMGREVSNPEAIIVRPVSAPAAQEPGQAGLMGAATAHLMTTDTLVQAVLTHLPPAGHEGPEANTTPNAD